MKSDTRKRKLSEFLRKILRAIAFASEKLWLVTAGALNAAYPISLFAITLQSIYSIGLLRSLAFGSMFRLVVSIIEFCAAVYFSDNHFPRRIAGYNLAFSVFFFVSIRLFLSR
jgi:hypothetical protein